MVFYSFEQYLALGQGLTMQLTGFSATIAADAQVIDSSWQEPRELQGGILEASGFDASDKIDVLAGYLNPPAPHPMHVPAVAVGDFVQVGPALALGLAVPPDGAIDTIVQTTKTVPPGIIIRVVYHTQAVAPVARVGGYWRTWFAAK